MDRLAKLVAAACLMLVGSSTAYAGYAQLAPPPGWSAGQYAPAANDAVFGRVIHAPNGPTTTVGGQAVKMPASYRFAANAPRFAAAAIFMHPYVRTGAAIAAWLLAGKIFWDEAEKAWKMTVDGQDDIRPAYQYRYNYSPWGTLDQACNLAKSDPSWSHVPFYQTGPDGNKLPYASGCNFYGNGYHQSYKSIESQKVPCPVGWTETPAGCVLKNTTARPLTQEEFEERLPSKPMPERVPLELPRPTPLPIEYPSPFVNPEPGENPQHRPLFVPTGDPVRNPDYDPNAAPSPSNQPYIQPGVRVVPSPTTTQPWRVDIQPVNRPAPTKQPMPAPEPEPVPDPQDPGGENGDKPKPEEQQSLCEKHPDIVACAKLGNAPEPEAVPNEDRELSIQQDSGWGEGSGSCPAPKTVQVHGFQLAMPFDLLCDFARGIRPVIIGLAWLAAAFTFMGLGRRE